MAREEGLPPYMVFHDFSRSCTPANVSLAETSRMTRRSAHRRGPFGRNAVSKPGKMKTSWMEMNTPSAFSPVMVAMLPG